VLPAWATVLIAIGGSLIGAAAGVVGAYFTLRGASLTIRHQEREAWRTRLIDAAQEFAKAYAAFAVLLFPATATPDASFEAPDDIFTLLQRLEEASTGVALVFGPDSEAYKHLMEMEEQTSIVMMGLVYPDIAQVQLGEDWKKQVGNARYTADLTVAQLLAAAHRDIAK
jgi:hypothetical protein